MGLAPRGKGVYVRDPLAGEDFVERETMALALAGDFALVHGRAGRREHQIDTLRGAGKEVWLYSLVVDWNPDNYARSVDYFAAESRRLLGSVRFVADPECVRTSPGCPRAMTEREARDLGQRLGALGGSVGVTSFPNFPHADVIAEAGDGNLWGSPQTYFKETYQSRPDALDSWVASWRAMDWHSVVPSVSLWQWNTVPSTPEAWRLYFSRMPSVQGAIGWATGRPSETILHAWSQYRPNVAPDIVNRAVMAAEQATGLSIEALAAILGGITAAIAIAVIAFGNGASA